MRTFSSYIGTVYDVLNLKKISLIHEAYRFIERRLMKFRKKPVVIDAVQFNGAACPDGVYQLCGGHPTGFFIDTLEGRMSVNVWDWIITGIPGGKYPCKPDIFEKTYEAVI